MKYCTPRSNAKKLFTGFSFGILVTDGTVQFWSVSPKRGVEVEFFQFSRSDIVFLFFSFLLTRLPSFLFFYSPKQ